MITIDDNFRCCLLSREPLIIANFGYPFKGPSVICPRLHGRKAVFLMGAWWTLLDKVILADLERLYYYFVSTYPQCAFMFLVNEPDEKTVLDGLGVPSMLCNHNSFIDESLFSVLPGARKRWTSVLTARPERFKRHLLARLVDSVALLFFSHGLTEGENRYLDMLRAKMPGLDVLNLDKDRTYRVFGAQQMNAFYNQARVGLSLSAVEGSNYSCTEYMLSGLPVVSTRNRGGRDHFLDPRYARIVEPEEQAVADAVAELAALDIDPHFVRAQTLARMHADRRNLIRLVQCILDDEGVSRDFAAQWPQVFTHRLISPMNEAQFLEHLAL